MRRDPVLALADRVSAAGSIRMIQREVRRREKLFEIVKRQLERCRPERQELRPSFSMLPWYSSSVSLKPGKFVRPVLTRAWRSSSVMLSPPEPPSRLIANFATRFGLALEMMLMFWLLIVVP